MLASGQTVTYGELDDDSARGATISASRNWCRRWRCHMVTAHRISEDHRAAQRAGIYYTPISTYFQATEVSYILENSDAKLVITTRELLGRLAEIPFNIALLLVDADCELSESWPRQRQAQAPELIDDEQEGSEMIYSSGTTGRPKGVRFPLSGSAYGNISATLQTRIDMHELSANTAYLSTAPLYHSAPLRYNMIVTRLGGTAFIMEKFDAESALRTIEAHKITHSQWVPTMFVRLLKLPDQTRQQYAIDSLRYVIHAAAPCPVDVKRDMIKWLARC